MPRRTLRLMLWVLGVVLLTACRLDVSVDVAIEQDGTGTLTVAATADAEVVQRAPGLAADLRFDDAVAAGWTVDGPTATDDGGLRLVLDHPVSSAAEATNLLASIGPPFSAVALGREVAEDGQTSTTTLAGELVLTGGFDAFADADLLAAVGGSPWATDLAESGAVPAETMTVVFRASLPGDVQEGSNGDQVEGARQWDAPLDGSTAPVQLQTIERPGGGGGFDSVLATGLLVLFVAWIAAAGAFIVSVIRARARRAQRRRRALSRLRSGP